jgi:transcriptional regulator with XRE-family HTH domain
VTPDPRNPLGAAAHNARHNIQRIREERGLHYAALSARLTEAGHPIPGYQLGRLEGGQRRIDVDDLAALARVLGVTPGELLEPPPQCEQCQGEPPAGFTCNRCRTTQV